MGWRDGLPMVDMAASATGSWLIVAWNPDEDYPHGRPSLLLTPEAARNLHRQLGEILDQEGS